MTCQSTQCHAAAWWRSSSLTPSRLRLASKRLRQIGDQIVRMFNPHGQPQQAVTHPYILPNLLRDIGMGLRGRICTQRLYPTQAFRKRNDAQALQETEPPGRRPYPERNHPAKSARLPAAARHDQDGRQDRDRRLLSQLDAHAGTGDRERIGLMPLHAQGERFHPAQQQPSSPGVPEPPR